MGYPAPADVRSGVAYGAANEITGLLGVPAAGDVRENVDFDSASSGALRVPAASDVLSGVGYGAGPGTEFTGAAAGVPVDADPALATGYADVYDGAGNLVAGGKVEIRRADVDAVAGKSYPRAPFKVAADANGRVSVQLQPSTTFEIRRDRGAWVAFTTPSSGTFALPGTVGREEGQ